MAAKEFKIRDMLVEDMEVVAHLGILENRYFRSHDLASAYAADPSGFFVGELNGEVISHIHAIKYPAHSAFIGTFIVAKEHRGKGYGRQTWDVAWKSVDKKCTIGLVATTHTVPRYEALGFCAVWNTFVAKLDVYIVTQKLANLKPLDGVSIKPTSVVDFEKVCSYDASVYGTLRRTFIEKWINMPGMLCWAAVDEKGDIVGYTAIRQFIKDNAEEIRLRLAPLYANNDQIAKALLKVATEAYQEHKQTSSSKIDLFFCDGESYGNHASQLMKELEATATLIGPRMYTRGIPPGRQQEKMYSIYLPAFD